MSPQLINITGHALSCPLDNVVFTQWLRSPASERLLLEAGESWEPGFSAAVSPPGCVDGDEELHVLRSLPGEVLHTEQQHVRVGSGGEGCGMSGPVV